MVKKIFDLCATAFAIIHVSAGALPGNPLLNINLEEPALYENLESSNNNSFMSLSQKPFSYYMTALLGDNYYRMDGSLKGKGDTGYFWKPLDSVTFRSYYMGDETVFMNGLPGTRLDRGLNYLIFEDGYLSGGRKFVAYYQFKQTINDNNKNSTLYRGYGKILLDVVSIEAGVDNASMGPGEYGLLLSGNTEPYPMVKIKTEDHLDFFGRFNFMALQGWLRENRDDYNNPRLLAARVSWTPEKFIEIGGSKTVLFQGDGRHEYGIKEYHKLLIGKKENISSSRYYNDAHWSYDLSLFLPLNAFFSSVKTSKLYFQDAGSEIVAPWQKEDKGKNLSDMRFVNRAVQAGLLIAGGKNIIRLEYSATTEKFYSDGIYTEGYTYKGFSLGHPYGNNTRSLFIKHRIYFFNQFSAEYRIGAYETPAFTDEKKSRSLSEMFGRNGSTGKSMIKYFGSLNFEFNIGGLSLDVYSRYERMNSYDSNPSPVEYNIIDRKKSGYLLGLSACVKL